VPAVYVLTPQKISVSAVGHGKNRPDISICSIPSIRIGSQKRTNLFDSKNLRGKSIGLAVDHGHIRRGGASRRASAAPPVGRAFVGWRRQGGAVGLVVETRVGKRGKQPGSAGRQTDTTALSRPSSADTAVGGKAEKAVGASGNKRPLGASSQPNKAVGADGPSVVVFVGVVSSWGWCCRPSWCKIGAAFAGEVVSGAEIAFWPSSH
jgi:hypothetical protein